MLKMIRKTATNPLAIVSVLLAVGAAIAVALLIVPGTATDSDGVADTGDVGGGGPPAQPLVEAYDSLPVPPRITVDEPPVSTGKELMAWYWAQDPPGEILAFYTPKLVAQGWRQETSPAIQPSDAKDDGSQAIAQSASFATDDLRLTISASPNTKDPARGATHFGITIQPR